MRIIVAITGATGAPLAITLLEMLKSIPEVETHLIISRWGKATIELETPYKARDVIGLADVYHSSANQGATISSGSFLTEGMIIIPCSMKTLAGIRSGYADGLIARAADVVLKERRRLVLVPRETPLSTIHLENMLALSKMGASIIPPMPAWYNHPKDLNDITHHIASRILDQFGLKFPETKRWDGLKESSR